MQVRKRLTGTFRSLRAKVKKADEIKESLVHFQRTLSSRNFRKSHAHHGFTESSNHLVPEDSEFNAQDHHQDWEDIGEAETWGKSGSMEATKRPSFAIRKASAAVSRLRHSWRTKKRASTSESSHQLQRVQNETIWTLRAETLGENVLLGSILPTDGNGCNVSVQQSTKHEQEHVAESFKRKHSLRNSARRVKKALQSSFTTWAETMSYPYTAATSDMFATCSQSNHGTHCADSSVYSTGTCYRCQNYHRNEGELYQHCEFSW